MNAPVLEVENLVKRFPVGRGGLAVHAINDVSFRIGAGETLGLVGESGSGKSTIGRTVLRLLDPTAGRIRFLGQDITTLPERRCRELRGAMQMVFQDPWSALNPRMSVAALLEEPLKLHTSLNASQRRDRVQELAHSVRLPAEALRRNPSGMSGGQLQRVCIARAIATAPKLIVLDEPTSSLDLSVRAGILDLLAQIQADTGVALLFITHDLGTVQRISDRIMVLYLGAVTEYASAEALFRAPQHPYSQALISAHLPADPRSRLHRHVLQGEIPSPLRLPAGCAFASRCPVVRDDCRRIRPPLEPVRSGDDLAACLRIADGSNRITVLEENPA
ncbi:ABC transporter ATP-binding protein [Roseomonas sp. BN140053]|uniref:ABC transporter ATP-binding protein n=1 Tax=Roseomonas sp. BN140053 TaxID=3391898 RepID=UPI0039EA0F68